MEVTAIITFKYSAFFKKRIKEFKNFGINVVLSFELVMC